MTGPGKKKSKEHALAVIHSTVISAKRNQGGRRTIFKITLPFTNISICSALSVDGFQTSEC